MSYGSEAIAEMEADFAVLEVAIETSAREGIWTTRDGRRIAVEDMTDSHIRNTIAYLDRNDVCDIYIPWIARLKRELKRRRA